MFKENEVPTLINRNSIPPQITIDVAINTMAAYRSLPLSNFISTSVGFLGSCSR
jgi:hypothetical protein